MAGAVAGGRYGRVRRRAGSGRAGSRCDAAARQDRRADAGERFFGRCAWEGQSVAERKAMIDRGHALPMSAQARQLGISLGSIYYLTRPVSDRDLTIMRRIGAASAVPVRRQPDAARSAPAGERERWPAACRDADEADRAGGALPTPEHVEAGAIPTCCASWR